MTSDDAFSVDDLFAQVRLEERESMFTKWGITESDMPDDGTGRCPLCLGGLDQGIHRVGLGCLPTPPDQTWQEWV